MRCSVSQMLHFADNNLLRFKALMRKMSIINRLIPSDNAIIKVLLGNMVARERMWEYSILVQHIVLKCLTPILDILY